MNINYNNFSRTTKFNDGDIPYITARNLEATGIVSHAFSTRIGGVSTGIYSSMNLTFTREDNPVNVSRNFELFAGATGVKTEDMVYSMQTHTTNVMEVTEAHRGMGVVKERDFSDIERRFYKDFIDAGDIKIFEEFKEFKIELIEHIEDFYESMGLTDEDDEDYEEHETEDSTFYTSEGDEFTYGDVISAISEAIAQEEMENNDED